MASTNKKNYPDQTSNFSSTSGDDNKEISNKYSLSKFDYDLYHEEDDKSEKVVRVKRVSMPNKGEKWKITIDNKLYFTVEGSKISKKEREFLQTVDGFNFMLSQAKSGIKSLNSFRNEMKKMINKKENPTPAEETPPNKE